MTNALAAEPLYESVIPVQVAISSLELAFTSSLKSLLTPTLPKHIAVALSGGADSLALTLLAHAWATQQGITLTTLTVDHRLREDSTAEAHAVAEQMGGRGIAHYILTPEHHHAGNNLMQAARQWRYDALADFCHTHSIRHCLLGHHRDDQLETVALAHLRGRKTLDLSHERSEGEAGMRAVRSYRFVDFLRPLLDVPKHALTDYLRTQGVAWVEDPTNTNQRFARARVRQQLADDPTLAHALGTTLANRRAARDAREEALAQAIPACVAVVGDITHVDMAAWRKLPPELGSLMLANLIRSIGGKPHRPRRHESERLTQALINEARGKRTLGHCIIAWKGGTATICPEPRE